MSSKLKPARVVRPGEILREELDARGWTQKDFAAIVGRPPQAISEIAQGRKSITPETAVLFGQALGTSAEMWLNLESAYRLRLAEEKLGDAGVAERATRFATDRRAASRRQRGTNRGFRIVLKPEGSGYVAQCAQLKLRAAGETPQAALDQLAELMHEGLQQEPGLLSRQ